MKIVKHGKVVITNRKTMFVSFSDFSFAGEPEDIDNHRDVSVDVYEWAIDRLMEARCKALQADSERRNSE